MFGTVIIDAYNKDEAYDVASAIDDLCCPSDDYGWSSAGIYCFWDYYTREILYIGLASDLAERFRQHNGIRRIREGSKQIKIENYFSKNEKLGYTIFVQSPLSQSLVHRNKKRYEKFTNQRKTPAEDMLDEKGREDIKIVEGILIESFKKEYGHIPSWNDIGGSALGQQRVMKNNINIVKSMCYPDNYYIYPILSRSTIRELSDRYEWASYEIYLHAARTKMLLYGIDYEEALNIVNNDDILSTYEEIKKSGYLKKKLEI